MFGVLIAATNPVSVIAAFKEMKVEPRLSLLVEAESLLNDGAAAVGFTVPVRNSKWFCGGPYGDNWFASVESTGLVSLAEV